MNKAEAIAQFVKEELLQLGPGIVFLRLKSETWDVAKELSAVLDLQVPGITSETPTKERQQLAEDLRCGTRRVVAATTVWATGIDIPAIRWVLWAGGGQAPILLKQAAARGTRLAEGKEGFVIYDWQEAGDGWGAERLQHYAAAGFDVEERKSSLGDRQLLETLLQIRPEEDEVPWGERPPISKDRQAELEDREPSWLKLIGQLCYNCLGLSFWIVMIILTTIFWFALSRSFLSSVGVGN